MVDMRSIQEVFSLKNSLANQCTAFLFTKSLNHLFKKRNGKKNNYKCVHQKIKITDRNLAKFNIKVLYLILPCGVNLKRWGIRSVLLVTTIKTKLDSYKV